MELLQGAPLVDKRGRGKTLEEALGECRVVVFYFSAHWCPPCRQFTPLLARAYTDSREPGKGGAVQVVFVSSDRSQQEMDQYMQESHGDWVAIRHGDPAAQALSQRFGVRGIPALKVVSKDGEEISSEAREEVARLGAGAFSKWELLAPAPTDTSSVLLLRDNPSPVKTAAVEVLSKLLTNVVNNPQEMKYRQVKLSNKTIEDKLLPASGAFEVLFSVGFEESGDRLVLPLSSPLAVVRDFLKAINNLDAPAQSVPSSSSPASATSQAPSSSAPGPSSSSSSAPGPSSSSSSAPGPSSSSSSAPGPSSSSSSSLLLPEVLVREREFQQKLLSQLAHMDSYERPTAQAAALGAMPVARFESAAREKLEAARGRGEEVKEELYRDLLLLEFKEWFKTDFFSWVDSPACPACGGETQGGGMVAPTPKEREDGAGRVEGYQCRTCGAQARFPRYHSKPEVLLSTRKGRCGEWANCFVLCCRALGFDTRMAVDWTDHVWAEVWSTAEDRWLHVDPGEAVDKTLVYEAGWGKKLTYVIATSKDEVQDVTWRYSKDHKETRARRTLVRPKWLTKLLLQLTSSRQAAYTGQDRDRLARRRLAECLELLTARSVGQGDTVGRQTGSLAWRMARGEVGAGTVAGHVFRPSASELQEGVMVVEYSVVQDRYYRGSEREVAWVSSEARGGKQGFLQGVHSASNLARKVEADWNMVYLARVEGSAEKGSVSWKISMEEMPGLEIGKVELLVTSQTFSSGRVLWQLCGGTSCMLPQPGVLLSTEQLSGSVEVTVSASLSGGEGGEAWQHAQLFRSARSGEGSEEPRFRIKLWIKKA